MGCYKKVIRFRFKKDKILGVILVAIGGTIVAVLLIPYIFWVVMFGIVLIITGYKLFLC